MFMIIAASAADAPTPTNALVLIGLIGVAGVVLGGRLAFDVRGAAGVALERRRVALQLKAQRSGNLGDIETESLGRWYFRVLGSVITAGGVILLLVDAIIATH
ncbi:hypothetical protein ACFYPN_32030 [Streptomyces sp. NPDC005576]|uniref:hypothetical protein n=1 Tax=unclassified Streptomyces TaxID=2593676 RepID=UPI0033C75634